MAWARLRRPSLVRMWVMWTLRWFRRCGCGCYFAVGMGASEVVEGSENVLIQVECGEHENARRGPGRHYAASGLDPVHYRHPHIHQHDVGQRSGNHPHGLLTVVRLTGHGTVTRKTLVTPQRTDNETTPSTPQNTSEGHRRRHTKGTCTATKSSQPKLITPVSAATRRPRSRRRRLLPGPQEPSRRRSRRRRPKRARNPRKLTRPGGAAPRRRRPS